MAGILDSPYTKLALDVILKLGPEQRTAIVEMVQQTLGVRVGFWDTEKEPPEGVVLLVEFETAAGQVPAYSIATLSKGEGKEIWLSFPLKSAIDSRPVKRWAVIPS